MQKYTNLPVQKSWGGGYHVVRDDIVAGRGLIPGQID